MDEKAGPEFGLKPSALGRHDLIGIGHSENLGKGNSGQTEGGGGLAGADFFFQGYGAMNAANKIQPGICPRIPHAQRRAQKAVLQSGGVELGDGISLGVRLPSQLVPATTYE